MVAERLHHATVEGRLLAEELDERLGLALSARTFGELEPLVADLPGSRTAPVGAPRRVVAIVARTEQAQGRHAAGGGEMHQSGVVADIERATLQARRWCDACGSETERMLHDCNTGSAVPTRHLRGFRFLDNDVVNFVSSTAGGLLAALLAR